MKRSATVSQNVRVLVTAAALAVGAVACGSKGNDTTGAGGAGGGAACTLTDVNAIFQAAATPYTGCTVINACHDNAGTAAGLDLTSVGWQTKLVGLGPVAGRGASATLQTMCAGMNRNYLDKGSNPATGLFIDKLRVNQPAPCGVHMPNLGAMLSATQFACVQSYATTLTTAP